MEPEAPDVETRAMAATGVAVAAAATLIPDTFLRTFGIGGPASGAAKLGRRLFAVRTATISVLATVASGAIIALDLKRRTAPARPRLGP